jgi:nucleoside-diphosphate-sugar epimerase
MIHTTAPQLPCHPDLIDDFLSEPGNAVVKAVESLPAPVGVLGAGGKMGFHVAAMLRRALNQAGRPEVPVYAISRFGSVRSRDEFEKVGVQTIAADLLDPEALEKLPDLGTAFFLAGMKFGTSDQPETLRLYNEAMPAMVAQRYASAVNVALSTGCVYPFAGSDSGGCTEEVIPQPPGDYARSCRGRELAFEKVSRETGAPVVLIRLNYAVEFRYGVLTDIARKVWENEEVDVSTGWVNIIWQRDAVEHIIRSAHYAESPAVPLNITGWPALSVREIAMKFGELLGRDVKITGEETSTAWLNNPLKSHRLFGSPAVSADEMISWVAAWIQGGGATFGKPTKFENREGKF